MEENKKYKCAKCKKEGTAEEGVMIWGGAAWCCNDCCGHKKDKDKKEQKEGVCEFC